MNTEKHYLHAGTLFVHPEPHIVTTVLGSCISICLWDQMLGFGGINHYQLPLWNGEGLASPKYGNVAINQLIKKMNNLGSKNHNLHAKIFGGGAVIQSGTNSHFNVGKQNIEIAWDLLESEKINVVASDVGGKVGRRLIFSTDTGKVRLKRFESKLTVNK
ncbi:chemotaxis protein CheD [bacterium]|nr:chemotaxis protein CheD [bacterium]